MQNKHSENGENGIILDKGKLKKELKKVYPMEKEEDEMEETRRIHYCYKPPPPRDFLE